MTETTNKIIKITSTELLILLLSWLLLSGACQSDLTAEDKQVMEELETILIKKHQKQNCLDNLSYLQSVENSKGLLYCNENDEEIKTKREHLLSHIAGEEYENVDLKIAEKISTNTWMDAIEKLSFLLSE